jgi:fused signal recognition particle receptor
MDPAIIVAIVIAVLVVGGLVYWFALRKPEELPPPAELKKEAKAEPAPKKAERADEKKPDAKKPEKKEIAESAPKKASAEAQEPPPKKAAPPPPEASDEDDEEDDEPAEPVAASQVAAQRAPSAPPAPAAKAPKKPSEEDIKALKKGLSSTRGGFIARLAKLFGGKKEIDPKLLEEIQEVLITADIGVRTSEKILERLKDRMNKNELSDEDRVWEALREEARAILGTRTRPDLTKPPSVILVVGVNGVGKTTTIGKLASKYTDAGKKVVLAAGDTFRAAAVIQLEVWGRRVGCPVVKGKERADPAAVIFDAIKKARDEGADIVIADTAGRLHTKTNLMEELKKVSRTAEKALERPVDEVLLVLDSTTGQNAIQQAQLFKDAIPVSGIALTKLDGTAKGGVILGIVDEHDLPVYFVGIGERVEDLREFDAATFVEALFSKPDDESLAA